MKTENPPVEVPKVGEKGLTVSTMPKRPPTHPQALPIPTARAMFLSAMRYLLTANLISLQTEYDQVVGQEPELVGYTIRLRFADGWKIEAK